MLNSTVASAASQSVLTRSIDPTPAKQPEPVAESDEEPLPEFEATLSTTMGSIGSMGSAFDDTIQSDIFGIYIYTFISLNLSYASYLVFIVSLTHIHKLIISVYTYLYVYIYYQTLL